MNTVDGSYAGAVVLTLDGINLGHEPEGYIAGDAAVTDAYIAADTVVTNAYKAADTVVTNAYTAADTVVTNAYTAAVALKLSLTGGQMSGNIACMTGVNPCFMTLGGSGNNAINFTDNAYGNRATLQYLQPSSALEFKLFGVPLQTMTSTLATFSVPFAMSTKKITGLAPGASASSDACTVAQMEAGDTAVTSAFTNTLTGYSTTAVANAATASTLTAYSTTAIANAATASTLTAYSTTAVANAATASTLTAYSTTAVANAAVASTLTSYSTTTQMNTALALKVSTTTLASYSTTAQMNAADALKLPLLGGTMGGILTMGGFRINSLGDGTAGSQNACTVSQMEAADDVVTAAYTAAVALKLNRSGGTLTGALTMSGQKILSVGNATLDGDAVNRLQVATGAIPRTAWVSGETIRRTFLHKGNYTLAPTVFTSNTSNFIVTTTFSVTAGNTLIATYTGGIDCIGGNTDLVNFEIEMFNEATNANSTKVAFPEYLRYVGSRLTQISLRALFVPSVTLARTVRVNFTNNSQEDTFTFNNANWVFSLEEIQA
jgi:hypothetical protein